MTEQASPDPIVPDDKDWTWVLDHQCPECGFDSSTVELAAMASAVRENAATWTRVLARPDARARPSADRWSALEYGCHVRDVFAIYEARLTRMIEEDFPDFANWNQDATAVAERYDQQDPAVVAADLVRNAELLAARYGSVTDWSRRGRRSDGAVFTIDSFSRYLLHDPVHHLWDVGATETGA